MQLRKFIQFADLHCTESRPIARLDDDWTETQRQAVRFIVDQAILRKCPVVGVGDIFDKPRAGTAVVVMLVQEFNRLKEHGLQFYLIAGNHDEKGATSATIHETSVGLLLEVFEKIPQIDGVQDAQHFGDDNPTGAPVWFTHQLIFKDAASKPPLAKGLTAQELLDANPSAQWIFTGDFHHHFSHIGPDGRRVVNTGNVIAHNASMIEVDANCAYIDLDAEVVEWIKIPDDPAMLTREHLDKVEERENRLEAFLEKAKEAGGVELTFAGKLEARMGLEDITQGVHAAYVAVKERATKGEV